MIRLEYHSSVRHSILTSIALLSLLALPVILVSTSRAQSGAAASSGGGHSGGGGAAGGASFAAHGSAGVSFSTSAPGSSASHFSPGASSSSSSSHSSSGTSHSGHPHPNPPGTVGDHHHRRFEGEFAGTVFYAVPFPYVEDEAAADNDADADAANDDDDVDADYQGGPTVFDRRGSGAGSYVPPVTDVSQLRSHSHSVDNAYAADEATQPPTTLVFKDGHELAVGNYAILGDTLFDLTPGHARRIALAQLDLDRTRDENENHGVVFELPSSPQAN
jgi:hypothetical protein